MNADNLKRCVLVLEIVLLLLEIHLVSSASPVPAVCAYYTDSSRTPNVYYEYRQGNSGLGWYWKYSGYSDSAYQYSNYQSGVTNNWVKSGSKIKTGEIQEVHTSVTEESDIGDLLGLCRDITGRGVRVDVELKSKEIRISFLKDNSFLNFNGAIFENITSQEKTKLPTYVYLDLSGDKITKADFIIDENGGTYNFNGEIVSVPPFSRIILNEEGISVSFPDGLDLSGFADFFEQAEKGHIDKIEGGNLKLPNGVILNGKLNFENGKPVLKKGDNHVWINGVQVGKRKADFSVFFDGERHPDEPFERGYISFGKDNLVVRNANAGKWQFINFSENNPYAKIDEGDILSLFLSFGSEASIQNRDSEGLIPKVVATGFVLVEEDNKDILYTEEYPDEIYFDSAGFEEEHTTSPIELFIEKGIGNMLGKDPTRKTKIIVDNSNRFAFFVPETAGEYSTIPEGNEYINEEIFFSSRLTHNYITEEDIKNLIASPIIFDEGENRQYPIGQGYKDAIIARLEDYYQTLTPETKQSLGGIGFSNAEKFGLDVLKFKSGSSSPDTLAYALNKNVFFRTSDISSLFSLGIFRHEFAHARHRELERIYNEPLFEEYEEKFAEYNELKRKLNNKGYKDSTEKSELEAQRSKLSQELDNLNLDMGKADPKKAKFLSDAPFFKKWNEVAGDIYGKISGVGETPKGKFWVYNDGSPPYLAKYGIVNAYGGKNLFEDTATSVEKISTNPSFFSCLIKPGCKDYDERYRKKLDLLHEYNFISKEEYDAVLMAAGVR